MYTNHLPDSLVLSGIETLRFPIDKVSGFAVVGATPSQLHHYGRLSVASCIWERHETPDGVKTAIGVDLGSNAIQGFAYAQNNRRLELPNAQRFHVTNGPEGGALIVEETTVHASEFFGINQSGDPQIMSWEELIHEAASKLITSHYPEENR